MDELPDPETYYDATGEVEWERLDRDPVTRFEFENTTAYLERLPADGRVLDAGGGAGRYSAWLAERGHDVTLLDRSAGQLATAAEKLAERGLDDRVAVERGDIRALPFEDDAFDGVTCLGAPLSHVLDADERHAALRELRRVARDGAPVFVSVVGRLAVLRDIIHNVLAAEHGLLAPIAETGDYTAALAAEHVDDPAWTEAHFFRADELEAALADAGFTVETLVGLEGVASNYGEELAAAPEAAQADVRRVVESLREDRAVVDLSNHILAVARA
ncbi:class I SAM-dependent methyltransferase [Halobacteriaceae archaeon GCM10025711]